MDVTPFETADAIVVAIEIALLLLGVAVLLRWQFSSRAAETKYSRLSPWNITVSDFLLRALAAVVGALVFQGMALGVQRQFETALTTEIWLIIQGSAFQFGILAGVLIGNAFSRTRIAPPAALPRADVGSSNPDAASPSLASTSSTEFIPSPWKVNPLFAGVMVFLAAIPLIIAISLLWQPLLKWGGFPVEQQEMIDLLANSDSPALMIGIGFLAVVIAPIVEETVFRAGLFCYLRTRVPRPAALLISAILFSALHANLAAFAPLVVFGVVLAIAYERTGNILVPMIAHSVFNLHTLALLLSGVSP